ncbi:bifunctional 3,4-dihydroxy-2-butanone-4-phosphate synthase/GTP cyclohydrolase II [Candidatus Peregrinibacteria bacterium CG_4_9_14_0_2_um_filter_41_14]|nr:MAG: bifunctional 3,4-dihydroxy-2-butanone-4-phosphate synthase/GTP cyclohydrolase II [Candidatus Peregrinibacteria bacterium CG_4_10_14_0_2_um_filter_41_8]PJC37706.1 MAG: bifunctional 3,4-dihydroxy-2-butanone-4-phosphate synthase/GTP cyclohydrolase II [Candidatus Peregrinibacteria bacterium CG_4_9_14_0_2_um_filter_41_14]
MFAKVDEAIADIAAGKMVIVCDDEDRENEGDLVMAAEKVTTDKINFMAKYGRGLICAPITRQRAKQLHLSQMVTNNTEATGCKFTVSVDSKDTRTGISAEERAMTIRKLLDETAQKDDFNRPGHIFPLIAEDGGVLVRAGQTEASVDLARLAGLKPAGVICEIMNDDGTMARRDDLEEYAKIHDLKIITTKDIIEYRFRKESLVWKEAEIDLPTDYGDFKMIAYLNKVNDEENVVLTMGAIDDGEPVLVRVHSECLTGDVFHSLRCDCQQQLEASMKIVAAEGRGVILYMRQEGRGIGLINKLKAYKLQEIGYDTVEANRILGFKDDLRHYGIGAQILVDLGIKKMRLLTNNPKKVVGLDGYGLEIVERVAIEVDPGQRNHFYLKTKKGKLGHMLDKV